MRAVFSGVFIENKEGDIADLTTLAILGPGKVGTAIGILAHARGYPVVIGGRNSDRTQAAAWRIGEEVRACTLEEAAGLGHVALLTVPDAAIETLCLDLTAARAFRAGAIVAHCSGALESTILASARALCDCAIASAHPLQTFPTLDAAVSTLPGTYWFCEGDARATVSLEALAYALGAASVIDLAPQSKAHYHAAAVIACNYFAALMDIALTVAEKAAIPREQAWAALEPLVRATLENIGAMGTEKALTGPIARGDIPTVQRHVAALSPDAEVSAVYRALGLWTTDLALRKGSITPECADRLRHAVNRDDGNGGG